MNARPDILLASGQYLCEDRLEQQVMKPHPPLGLLYLSSFLKQQDLGVEVFDGMFAAPPDFERAIDDLKPLSVGITCNMGTKLNVLRMIRQAQERGIVVILGGPEPVNHLREYLDYGADYIVIGEGEITLEQLLLRIKSHDPDDLGAIPGIAFVDGSGAVVRTEARPPIANPSDLPWPDRGAIDMGRYLSLWRAHHGYGPVSLICARGCPYRCTWCSHSVFGRTHRRRDPVEVADEVEHIRATSDADALWFADDVFNIDHKWLYAFRDEMVARRLPLPFECICRGDRMNERVIEALADLKCNRVWIGAESGSQRVLDAMRRGVKTEQVRSATRMAKAAGLEVGTFIMLGYDGEELQDIEATVKHLRSMAPDTVLTTLAYPIKGTEYYEAVSDRIAFGSPWPEHTDRDLRVRGRYPRRFYEFANCWVSSEVQHFRASRSLVRSPWVAARAYVRARWYRYQTRRLARRIESSRRVSSGRTDSGHSLSQRDFLRASDNTCGKGVSCGTGVSPANTPARRHSGVVPDALTASPFDPVAPGYDQQFTESMLGRWLRERVWERLDENILPGCHVLELGGGTGEDACWLARRGVRVTTTDDSAGMLEVAARKIAEHGLSGHVTTQLLNMNRLPPHTEMTGPFDAVLANFGGVNCVEDRRGLASWLAQRIGSGAYVALTVMGPYCPWEIAALAITHPATCLRRWRRDGTAYRHGNGRAIRVRYPSPAQLGAEFAPWFERVRLTGLGVLLPPTRWQSLVDRWPRFFAMLGRIERAVACHWPATWLCDHYVLELRRR